MAKLDVEGIDLAELLQLLQAREADLAGDLAGRSAMRDIVALHLGCSMLEAEELVDTIVIRQLAQLQRDPEGREGWRITPTGYPLELASRGSRRHH